MRSAVRSLNLATALLATAILIPAARAQTAPAEQPAASASQELSMPFGGPVPAEIFGIPCKANPGTADFAPHLICMPADMMKQPSISVSVAEWKSHPSRAEIIALVREAFHERSMFNVIREEAFTPPGDPEAVGFRALYQTDLGNRYVWAVLSRGRMIRVTVMVLARTDFAAMTADIEAKVFAVPRP